MKRLILLFLNLSFILILSSCKATDPKVAENDNTIPSDTQTTDVIVDIPADIEVVYNGGMSDRVIYEDLKQVEDKSSLIIKAVPKKNLGQEVSTTYDYELNKDLPDAGYTKWEFEITKVYKGDVDVKDKLVLLHDYYVWPRSDGKKQLITLSSLKPALKDKEYLMFLQYDDINKGYWLVGDYMGMFAIPTDEIKAKIKAKTLKQPDIEVYDYEPLQYLIPIYSEVAAKYFN